MFGVMGWQNSWLGAACRQQVKVAVLSPHEQCLRHQQARKNRLATPAELLIAPSASQHPYHMFFSMLNFFPALQFSCNLHDFI